MIAGSWAEWQPQVMFPVRATSSQKNSSAGSALDEEIWRADFLLPNNAEYSYKFIVDGVWRHDGSVKAAKNKETNEWENVLTVSTNVLQNTA